MDIQELSGRERVFFNFCIGEAGNLVDPQNPFKAREVRAPYRTPDPALQEEGVSSLQALCIARLREIPPEEWGGELPWTGETLLLQNVADLGEWIRLCGLVGELRSVELSAEDVLAANELGDIEVGQQIDRLLELSFQRAMYQGSAQEASDRIGEMLGKHHNTSLGGQFNRANSCLQGIVLHLTKIPGHPLTQFAVPLIFWFAAWRLTHRTIRYVRVKVIPRLVVKICIYVPGVVVKWTSKAYDNMLLVWIGAGLVAWVCPSTSAVTGRISHYACQIFLLPWHIFWLPFNVAQYVERKVKQHCMPQLAAFGTWSNQHMHRMVNQTEAAQVEQAKRDFVQLARREMGLPASAA